MNVLAIVLQEAGEPGIFDLSLGVSAWTLIIFLILLWILSKYAFPPILDYANERERRIQETLDEAAREREEAERMAAERKRELAEAGERARELIGEGREAAESVREELIEQARADQEEMLVRAREEIERERERAVDSVRREAVDLSIAAASKLVERNLDTEADRRLVREYLDRIGSAEEAVADERVAGEPVEA